MSQKKGSFKKASFRRGSRVIFNDYWKELVIEEYLDQLDLVIADIFENIRDYEDEKAFVLIGAMLVENVLDGYLFEYIRGYDKIRKLREVTLSTKIELAKSLWLSPVAKLNALEIIRKIRNQFAHNIPLQKLEDIEEKHKQSLLSNVKKFESKRSEKLSLKSTKELFEILVINVAKMLLNYQLHIKLLSTYIRSDEIYDALEDFYHRNKNGFS